MSVNIVKLPQAQNFDFQQVSNFYNNAWGMLMTAGGILLGVLTIVGVGWPIFMFFFQNHTYKMREKRIEDKFKQQLIELEFRIKETQGQFIQETNEIKKRTWHTLGDSQFGLAQLWNKNEAFDVSLIMTINAIRSYLMADDEKFTDAALSYLIKSNYLKISTQHVSPNNTNDIVTTLKDLILLLTKHNDTGKYSEAIDAITKAIARWTSGDTSSSKE